MPRHATEERKRERGSEERGRKSERGDDYSRESKSSRSYHRDDQSRDDSSKSDSRRESKHSQHHHREEESSCSRSRKREDRELEKYTKPVQIENDYHHERNSRNKRSVKANEDYEAVSEDDNDSLIAAEDSRRKDSNRKKRSNRDGDDKSSEAPKRRVFYEAETDAKQDKEKESKKSKRDKDAEEPDRNGSRKHSETVHKESGKKTKRDSKDDRGDDEGRRKSDKYNKEDLSESEKQKLRRERAKNFTERLSGDSAQVSSAIVTSPDLSSTGSQWVAVNQQNEHLFITKQVVNDRLELEDNALDPDEEEADRYDPTLPTEDADAETSNQLYHVEELDHEETSRDTSEGSKKRRHSRSHERRHSSTRKSDRAKVFDEELYENEPISPENIEDFSYRDSAYSKDRSYSRRSSDSRHGQRNSRSDRRPSSREREELSRRDFKERQEYSTRDYKDASSHRSRRQDDKAEDGESSSKRTRREPSAERSRNMENERRVGYRRESSGLPDEKFKHPGSPVDPNRRRSHRDSYENSSYDKYRDRSADDPNRHHSSVSRDRGESGHRHHHASSVERTEEADLEKLATELKDFGGVADDGSSSGRKRERSIDDDDIEVQNPTPPKQIMKMSEFSHLPKQFGWPKMKDERDLSGVKGLAMSNAALNQTLTQKERFSSEAIIAKYNLKQSLSTSLSSSGNLTSNYDKFSGLNNLLSELRSSKFATGTKADMQLRQQIQKCANLTLTVSCAHPMFKTFKSLSKSFLVKNYDADAK